MKKIIILSMFIFTSCTTFKYKSNRHLTAYETEVTEPSTFFYFLVNCKWADLNSNRWDDNEYYSYFKWDGETAQNSNNEYKGTVTILTDQIEGQHETRSSLFYWGSDTPNEGTSRWFIIDSDLKSGQTELHFNESGTINQVLIKNIVMKNLGQQINLSFKLYYDQKLNLHRGAKIKRDLDSENNILYQELKFSCLLL
jgi:hypothetical protein